MTTIPDHPHRTAPMPERSWREELIRLGGSIHQDDAPDLDAAAEAEQQAGITRYLAMLDAVSASEQVTGDLVATILWSLHPLDDYGIYEAAYGVLSTTDPTILGTTVAEELPRWLADHGDHHSIATASSFIPADTMATTAFLAGAKRWSPPDRRRVRQALRRWTRENAEWEDIAVALGERRPEHPLEPIPDSWPEEWRAAAEAFRESGRVDRIWTNERDFPSNFDRVLALLELGHGKRWREVPDMLNALLVRRRKEIPGFVTALRALPEERRERILDTLSAARPEDAEFLRDLGAGGSVSG